MRKALSLKLIFSNVEMYYFSLIQDFFFVFSFQKLNDDVLCCGFEFIPLGLSLASWIYYATQAGLKLMTPCFRLSSTICTTILSLFSFQSVFSLCLRLCKFYLIFSISLRLSSVISTLVLSLSEILEEGFFFQVYNLFGLFVTSISLLRIFFICF
jgi:hypothetical protein